MGVESFIVIVDVLFGTGFGKGHVDIRLLKLVSFYLFSLLMETSCFNILYHLALLPRPDICYYVWLLLLRIIINLDSHQLLYFMYREEQRELDTRVFPGRVVFRGSSFHHQIAS